MIMRTDGTEVSLPQSSRNREILTAVKRKEEVQYQETKILQKVNKVKREAFKEKYPGQVEHCMRLTAERLQAILTNKPSDLTKTTDWQTTTTDIKNLCEGLYYLSTINQMYPVQESE